MFGQFIGVVDNICCGQKRTSECTKYRYQESNGKVPPQMLIQKIKVQGMEDQLATRKHKKNVIGNFSGWQDVTSGMPEGWIIVAVTTFYNLYY